MIIQPAQAWRLFHINRILLRHGLDEVILATHLFRPLRWLRFVSPAYWSKERRSPPAVRIRQALEDLGPIYVKFGQNLSTRRDLLPPDVADELAKLQDRVTPFPGEQAKVALEQAYGRPLDQVFRRFDLQPLASASIAQVHLAELLDGTEVVVKVLRPGIERRIRRDTQLLRTLARLAHRYWREGRRLRPREVVAEYEKTLFDELDLMREAANASQLRRNFLNSPLLYIPEVYWDYSRRNVMVMERITGTPVSHIEQLKRQGIDLKRLSERGVEIFFTQVFRDNFFHADMHPGNIFVSPEGQWLAVDFGIMGTLSPSDQRYLAENFVAFFNRDYRRVAELHVQSGWVPASTRIDEFEAAIRSVCEPIFEKPLKDISFGHLLLRLFQTARRFNMEVQPQLVLLHKTLLNIEGLGRELYPELDLWKTAKPYLESWMRERLGPRAAFSYIQRNWPELTANLPQIPSLVYGLLEQAHSGKLQVQWAGESADKVRREVRRANRRTFAAVVGGSLIVSAAVLLGLDNGAAAGAGSVAPWLVGAAGVLVVISHWPRGD